MSSGLPTSRVWLPNLFCRLYIISSFVHLGGMVKDQEDTPFQFNPADVRNSSTFAM